MSNLAKHPKSTLRLWLRLGRLLTLTGVISLLALWGLLGCTTQPDDEVVVVVPTPAPATPQPTSLPTTTPHPTPTTTLTPQVSIVLSEVDVNSYFNQRGLEMAYQLDVSHQGPEFATGTLYVTIFDGDPTSDGQRVVQMVVPNITTQTQSVTATWNVVGQLGGHTLYEFYCLSPTSFKSEDCLIGQRFFGVDRIDFQIETESDTTTMSSTKPFKYIPKFWQGEIIPIKTLVANLTLTETLVLTSTTYIGLQNDVFFPDDKFSPLLDVEVITLAPGEQVERDYLYDSTYLKGGQLPLTLRVDEILEGDIHPWAERNTLIYLVEGIDFTVTPAFYGHAPFTVTFTDRSTPVGNVEAWLWSFGNGVTSTLSSPSHTYVESGFYTVTLTTTVMIEGQPAVETSASLPQTATLSSTKTYTAIFPSLIHVLSE